MSDQTTVPGARNFMGLTNLRRIRDVGFLDFLMASWKTYGDLFFIQFGQRGMHVAVHPEMVRQVSMNPAYSKAESYEGVRQYVMGDGLVTSVGESWRMQRKLFAPFFTPRGIAQYAGMIRDESEIVLRKWDRFADKEEYVDVSEDMLRFAARVILKTVFSVESDEHILSLSNDVETALAFSGVQRRALFKKPLWWPSPVVQNYNRAYERLRRFVADLISQRRAMPEEKWPADILSKMLLARDEQSGRVLSDALIFDNCMTLFVAGHETTARSLAFSLYLLSQYPEVEEKLTEEVDRVLGEKPVDVTVLKQMPYTLQVIKETLRLYPVAAFYPRDLIKGDVLHEYPLTTGQTVMLFPYATHRHPEFWENPDRFDPDRFTPEAEAARHPYAYAPFAAGRRVCIGNNFSLLESQIFLASLYRRFRVQLRPDHDPRIRAVATIMPTAGVPMRIKRR